MPYQQDEDDRPDEDEGNEISEYDYKTQKDAVLFAIEVNDSMLRKRAEPETKDTDSAVVAALKSASTMMQQRIISQPKDIMGIMFFGTEKTKFRDNNGSTSQYPNCYLHTDLDVPSAQVVKTLKSLTYDGEDPDSILIPSGGEAPIKSMLFAANQIFTTGAPNFGSRRLFVVTDNDDPFKGDKARRDQAAVRAKDLFDLGVTIELFPVSDKDHKFDVEKFYTDIIYIDPAQAVDPEVDREIKTVNAGDGMSLLDSLTSRIIAKQSPKRAYFSNMPFELAPGMTISVNGYLLLHRQKIERSCYVYLEKDNDRVQLVQGEVTKTEEGTMRTVEQGEIKKAYKFGTGGDYIYFTPQELERIKHFEDKCLRVIGFKPQSLLPPWAAVKKSIFIFPTETGYVGSTRVFSALWQTLLKSKKMAIAWYVARKNAVPQIVAILPSKKQSDETSGTSYLPAGLWLYPLPFVDDCRDIESVKPKSVTRAPDELITQMRTIVQNLKLPKDRYDPAKYPNPALQHHYKVLQSLALDEDVVELKQEDLTLPRYKQIHKRVGGYQVEFKQQLEDEAALAQQALDIKREIEDDADDRPKKKIKTTAKTSAPAGGTSLAELSSAVDDNTLRKKTVAELKAICDEKGLITGGKKADLLGRIEQWVERSS
ncbi:unnamed protein product [Discula destructiva]